jgi:uncharacterized protein YjdB
MGVTMKKILKRIAVLLCICLIAPTILNCIPLVNTVTQAEAAAKTKTLKLDFNKGNVGISSSPEYIWISSYNENAKYTYSSNNKKVAKVDKNGKITGVSKGTAKITVKEVVKGKTTKTGIYTVSVVDAALESETVDIPMFSAYYPPIAYRNFKASYSGVSDDTSIVTLDKDANLIRLKAGKTTVTFKETYKSKTKELGKVTVNVIAPSITPEYTKISVGINQAQDASYLFSIDNYSWDAKYSYESADPSIVSITPKTDDFGYTYSNLEGLKLGTTTVTIYSEYEGQKVTVGTVDVTVKEIPVTSFEFDNYYKDEDGKFKMTYYLGEGDDYSNLTAYINKEPYEGTTPVTFSTSDATVATVDNNGKVTTYKKGTAEITATCGTFSDKLYLTVDSYDE